MNSFAYLFIYSSTLVLYQKELTYLVHVHPTAVHIFYSHLPGYGSYTYSFSAPVLKYQ